ncbi:Scramblase [Actinomadura rubteroloni]|uniref:Scramblase n=1 Tax=Actinomadura rubteroloni TaxID=1926885 RepID=A0A2P4UKP0_9ACTN|nr:phospholipid scramblase-related protein [Actinomadura rubteroloni]POM25622.1 Scramblase [Actinomadura rubteroloni]
MTELFTAPFLRVEQPRRGPAARTRYRVLDDAGTVLAVAAETGERSRAETLKTVFPGKSGIDARAVLLTDPGGAPLLIVDKAAGRTLITLRAPDGAVLGTYTARHAGRRFALRDAEDRPVGALDGDLSRRNFTVTDPSGATAGTIRKRFAGVATHLLTTADKYDVTIGADVAEPLRTFVVAGAIAMDLALHEAKEVT